ncbi:MAG: nicotinate (nicotinamide) nucleotide adenylyltransferase [Lachnospiraceae bacterium]|nr:nicotinate (nicotinamide) nucleotide adenylyltransferase [Lachnospiraceae bacterium]
MDRIGILGGTFNPIHIGHLILAENAYEQYSLDKVWIMPSGMPPHKSDLDVVSAEVRSAMVKLSIAGNRHLKYSGFELERSGYIYTVETLKLLKDKYPDTEFNFIIGEDSLDTFDKWRMPEEIVKLAKILVAVRSNEQNITEKVNKFNDFFKCDAKILNTPFIDISSNNIRKRVAEGKSIKYMVTADVERYIYNNGLYQY